MTDKQLRHYLLGGHFSATYQPKVTSDLSIDNRMQIGKEIVIFQNLLTAPLISPKEYSGQHAFSSFEIAGWSPEEDFVINEIIYEFLNEPVSLPQYLFRLTYTTKKQIRGNFGHEDATLPLVVGRQYAADQTSYVLHELSDPPATTVEKAIWYGEPGEPVWKKIN